MNKQTTTITIIIAVIIIIAVTLAFITFNKSKSSNNRGKDQKVQETTKISDKPDQSQPDKKNSPQLANPASVYCIKNGGKHITRKDDKSNEIGICVFPNGKECNEWEFYKGNCAP